MKKYFSIGINDYINSIKKPMTWLFIGLMDVSLQYKRTILGPWWNTMGIVLIISVLSSIWANLLKIDINFFIPYFTIGFIVWSWFSSTLIDMSKCLIEVEGLLKQVNIPLSSHLLRISIRNFIIFLHNSALIFLVITFFNLDVLFLEFILFSLPGIVLIFLSINSLGIIISLLSLRYRDIGNLIFFVLQILFFLTPVLWHPDILDKHLSIVEMNPMYYWVDIIRQPILGLDIHNNSLIIIATSTIVLLIISFYMIGKYKNRLIYWL